MLQCNMRAVKEEYAYALGKIKEKNCQNNSYFIARFQQFSMLSEY